MSPDEAKVVRPIIQRGLDAGYSVSVFDGEEWTVKRSTDRDRIMAALGTTDDDTVRFRNGDDIVGSILLVYGNAPDEVVSDCTDNAAILALVSGQAQVA